METCSMCGFNEGDVCNLNNGGEGTSFFPHCVNQDAFPCLCGKALQEHRKDFIRVILTESEARYITLCRAGVSEC